jgi:hypothetical protein
MRVGILRSGLLGGSSERFSREAQGKVRAGTPGWADVPLTWRTVQPEFLVCGPKRGLHGLLFDHE